MARRGTRRTSSSLPARAAPTSVRKDTGRHVHTASSPASAASSTSPGRLLVAWPVACPSCAQQFAPKRAPRRPLSARPCVPYQCEAGDSVYYQRLHPSRRKLGFLVPVTQLARAGQQRRCRNLHSPARRHHRRVEVTGSSKDTFPDSEYYTPAGSHACRAPAGLAHPFRRYIAPCPPSPPPCGTG
jgi:hypothetical protein